MFVFLFPDRSALEYLLSVFRPSAVCISPSRLTCRKEELHPILCKDKKNLPEIECSQITKFNYIRSGTSIPSGAMARRIVRATCSARRSRMSRVVVHSSLRIEWSW